MDRGNKQAMTWLPEQRVVLHHETQQFCISCQQNPIRVTFCSGSVCFVVYVMESIKGILMKVIIINSAGFWSMGWATDARSQQAVIGSLQRAGVDVEVSEVSCVSELRCVLSSSDSEDCLIWPNAYEVFTSEGGTDSVWMADIIETMGFRIIGNNARVLRNVLSKAQCQAMLRQKNTSVPGFFAALGGDPDYLAAQISEQGLAFPLFTKPDNLSTSKGITQNCITHNMAELSEQVNSLGEDFGFPVMVEEYLPGRDITVAVFMAPEKPVILATYYDIEIGDNPGVVLDYNIRLKDWNDGKWLTVVTEPETLQKIEDAVLPVCAALEISEFTRVDCRFDQQGNIRVFDVNGLPGLELPFSTTVWQMIIRMNDVSEQEAFDTLIALILHCACHRYQVPEPSRISYLAQAYIQQQAVRDDAARQQLAGNCTVQSRINHHDAESETVESQGVHRALVTSATLAEAVPGTSDSEAAVH